MKHRALLVVVAVACGDHESAALVATLPEPAGQNCPVGGVVVETGLDTNDDGSLQFDEVTSTVYICWPVPSAEKLVRVVAEPPGANCADGGQAIQTGVDVDGDGVLDDSEVTSTSYVCSGANGNQTLVRVQPEAAGPNCAYGGQAIAIGSDIDDDGLLDDNEVATISYVCSGANGQTLVRVDPVLPGSSCANGGQAVAIGLDSDGDGTLDDDEISSVSYVCAGPGQPLIRVEPEPAGANCASGGTAIRVGIDTDNDGVLQDLEVQSSSYLCDAANPTTIEGSFVVHNSIDAAFLVGVTTITGDLTVDANGLTSIDLSSLQEVGGDLMIEANALAAIDLGVLDTVGGSFQLDASTLVNLDITSLQSAGGDITIDAPLLSVLELASLRSAASFEVVRAAIEVLDLPLLEELDEDLIVTPSLVELAAPALEEVGGSLRLHADSVVLPALARASYVQITARTALGLPSLDTVNSINLSTRDGFDISLPRVKAAFSMGIYGGGVFHAPQLLSVDYHFGAQRLGGVDVPMLHDVGETSLSNISSLYAPSLKTIRTLHLYFSDTTATLEVPATIEFLHVTQGSNATLTLVGLNTASDIHIFAGTNVDVRLPDLVSVTGQLKYSYNHGTPSVTFPSLITVGSFNVFSNPDLSSFTAPVLTHCNALAFGLNPMLPSSQIATLSSQCAGP